MTVPPKPKGLPIAITQSPILALSEFPNFTGVNLSSESICNTAISDNGSEPIILALYSLDMANAINMVYYATYLPYICY